MLWFLNQHTKNCTGNGYNFINNFLSYSIKDLDRIIKDGITGLINESARSDSDGVPNIVANDSTNNSEIRNFCVLYHYPLVLYFVF